MVEEVTKYGAEYGFAPAAGPADLTVFLAPPYTGFMSQAAPKPVLHDPDPFYWGSRLERVAIEGRGSRLVEIPLTREDLLDPQEGDMMVHGPLHGLFIRTLADMLDRWLDAEDVAVFDDVKMLWGRPGVSDVAPDISVIRGIRDKWRDRASFSVAEEDVAPCLVIEVISPRYREIDEQDKLEIYRRARIPEYLIIDITKTPIELAGYRLSASGRYRRSPGGTFSSQTTGLSFAPGSEDLEIVVEDVATGTRLLTSSEESALRREEAVARAAAEQRAAEEAAIRRELEDRLRRLQATIERLQSQQS
ncbi:MAG: Uma2 family endonuclease [bacterium]|nr:Uma2 family endonuclease [bacterium]